MVCCCFSTTYHSPVRDVIEAFKESNSRTFAATGSSDESDSVTERHIEVEVTEHLHGGSGWVVERHTTERYLAFHGALRK